MSAICELCDNNTGPGGPGAGGPGGPSAGGPGGPGSADNAEGNYK